MEKDHCLYSYPNFNDFSNVRPESFRRYWGQRYWGQVFQYRTMSQDLTPPCIQDLADDRPVPTAVSLDTVPGGRMGGGSRLTNDAGHFLPQKVRPMSLHRPHFFRRNCHGLVRLGPRAYCKVRVESKNAFERGCRLLRRIRTPPGAVPLFVGCLWSFQLGGDPV